LRKTSQRKQAKARLRESKERHRAMINQATAGMAKLDLTGKFTLVNQRFCDITDYTRAELLERRLHDITHPDDFERCLRCSSGQ